MLDLIPGCDIVINFSSLCCIVFPVIFFQYFFFSNITCAHRVAASLNAGGCWINTYNIFRPHFPGGGFKMSGIGRENGHQGLDAYTQTKVVYVGSENVETPF